MSQLTETSATHGDVNHGAAPNSSKDAALSAPVLITEQEVLFGSRAATLPRRASLTHRMIAAVRTAATSLRLPVSSQRLVAGRQADRTGTSEIAP